MIMNYSDFNIGLTVSTSSSLYAGIGSGPIFVFQSHCTGSESSLDTCRLSMNPGTGYHCNHFYDVTLNCIGKLKLKMHLVMI